MIPRRAAAALVLLLAGAPLATAQDTATTVTAGREGAAPTTIDLAPLPPAKATLELNQGSHTFEGPLLWTVLTEAHLIDPARHAESIHQILALQGADGYTALLAVGELSPDFEAKPAILAIREDGKTLSHPRAIIPADHRAGRSVRDVVRIILLTPAIPKP